MFSRIVVGIDGSDPSNRAVKAACDLAKMTGAKITLVHTPRPETVAFAMGAISGYHMVTTMPEDAEVREAARKLLGEAQALAQTEGCDIAEADLVVRRGDPGDEVLALAKEGSADLIVTGRRGLGSLAGLMLGSTSQRITHLATCAVLSVP